MPMLDVQVDNGQLKRVGAAGKRKAPENKASGAQKRFCLASLDSIIQQTRRVNPFFQICGFRSLKSEDWKDGNKKQGRDDSAHLATENGSISS